MNAYPGWINIDNSLRHIVIGRIPFLPDILFKMGFLSKQFYIAHKLGKFKNVVYGDATKRMRFGSNSVDYIYSSHMLEHLYSKDAVYFLSECRRVLKKGGILRLLLPDLEVEAKTYLKSLGSSDVADVFCGKVYATSFKDGYKNSHKWMYDRFSLGRVLKGVDFSDVVIGKFREGEFPDVGKLDSHKGSLILEGVK